MSGDNKYLISMHILASRDHLKFEGRVDVAALEKFLKYDLFISAFKYMLFPFLTSSPDFTILWFLMLLNFLVAIVQAYWRTTKANKNMFPIS